MFKSIPNYTMLLKGYYNGLIVKVPTYTIIIKSAGTPGLSVMMVTSPLPVQMSVDPIPVMAIICIIQNNV